MSDNLNSIDLDLLATHLTGSETLRASLKAAVEAHQSLETSTFATCASRFASYELSGTRKVSELVDAWGSNDRWAGVIHDELAGHGSGEMTFDSAAVGKRLEELGAAGRPGAIGAGGGELLGVPPTSGFADDPICTANGNFVHQEADLSMPGYSACITPARTYNSLANHRTGIHGRGWSSTLDMAVLVDADAGVVTVRLEDGAEVSFLERNGEFAPNARRELQLSRMTSGGWRLTGPEMSTWEFAADGLIAGGTLGYATYQIERSAQAVLLTEVRSGRTVSCVLNSDGFVESVVSSDGRSVSYRYDDSANCIGVARPEGTWIYEVEDDLLIAAIDADGVELFRNTYLDDGRVESQRSPHGLVARYAYLPNAVTRITYEPTGEVNLYSHDVHGNVTAMFDGEGHAVRLTWDRSHRLVRSVDRNGAVTSWQFDHDPMQREPLSVTYPDGAVESYSYDETGRLVEAIGPLGGPDRLVYSEEHAELVSRIEDAAGASFEASYNDAGLPLEISEHTGVTTRLEWDRDGHLTVLENALGARTTFTYDNAGRLIRTTDPLGVSESYEFEDSDQPVAHTSVDGVVQQIEYSPAGRMLQASVDGVAVTSATYDNAGELQRLVDAAGVGYELEYNAAGDPIRVTDTAGGVIEHTYDRAGRVLARTSPTGGVTQYAYDNEGNLVSETDADGYSWQRAVDAVGRTTSVTAPGGQVSQWRYHLDGQIAAYEDPVGRRWTFEIDEAGRLVREVDALGNATSYGYNAIGDVTHVVGSNGSEYRFEYDELGRLIEIADPAGETVATTYRDDGTVASFSAEGSSTSLTYDEQGRLVAWESEDGKSARHRFDPKETGAQMPGAREAILRFDVAGRLQTAVDAAGVATTYAHDSAGRLAGATTAGSSRAFAWQADGLLSASTDALGLTSTLDWSPAGRLRSMTNPERTLLLDYDETGALAAVRNDSDKPLLDFVYGDDQLVGAVRTPEGQVSLERDALGRPATVVGLNGERTTYQFDPEGYLLRRADSGGTVDFLRSASGELIGFRDSDVGDVDIPDFDPVREFDDAGRITSDERGSTHRYDDAGRLRESLASDGGVRRFDYNDAGLLAADETPTFGARRFSYNAAGAVSAVETEQGESTLRYDGAGRRVGEEDPDGSSVKYTWDDLDQLVRIDSTETDGSTRTTRIRYSGFGRPEAVNGVSVGWKDAGLRKPVQVGDQRFLRYGLAVRECSENGEWTEGVKDDPFGYSEPSSAPRLGYRGELEVDGCVFMGARVYHPETRSFLTPDPLPPVAGALSFAGEYTYAYNDPVNLVDPSGGRPLSDADLEVAKQELEKSAWDKYGKVGLNVLSVGLDFVPIVGNVKGLIEGAVGYDMAGNKLEPWERALAMLGPAGKAVRLGAKGIKVAKAANRMRKTGKFGAGGMAKVLGSRALRGTRRGVASEVANTRAFFKAIPGNVSHGVKSARRRAQEFGELALDAVDKVGRAGKAAFSKGRRKLQSVVAGNNPINSPWNLGWSARGFAIENILGGNLPKNFPTIDRFSKGTATSIKSIDLTAASYQRTSALSSRLSGYVDKAAGFNGANWSGVRILPDDVVSRRLEIAVQTGVGNSAQRKVLDDIIRHGERSGVDVQVVSVP